VACNSDCNQSSIQLSVAVQKVIAHQWPNKQTITEVLFDTAALLAVCSPFLRVQSVRVDEILGADKAKEVIEEAIQMYVDNYVPKKYRVTK
jgi:hypothetical protein